MAEMMNRKSGKVLPDGTHDTKLNQETKENM